MELRYYLFKEKMSQAAFGRLIKAHPSQVHSYVHKKVSPSVEMCARIYIVTKGEVSFMELIKDSSRIWDESIKK